MEWTVDVTLGSKPEVNRNDDSRTNARANERNIPKSVFYNSSSPPPPT
jgi:hypothetical protein